MMIGGGEGWVLFLFFVFVCLLLGGWGCFVWAGVVVVVLSDCFIVQRL